MPCWYETRQWQPWELHSGLLGPGTNFSHQTTTGCVEQPPRALFIGSKSSGAFGKMQIPGFRTRLVEPKATARKSLHFKQENFRDFYTYEYRRITRIRL